MQRRGKGFHYIFKIMNQRIDLSSLYDFSWNSQLLFFMGLDLDGTYV
jgi:hypothetical protein